MILGLCGTTPALADSPCTYDAGTHTATYAFNLTVQPNLPTVQRAGIGGMELFVGTDGGSSADLCTDGATSATVLNTDTIKLTGNPPGASAGPRVQFFFLNGPFAPGFTNEGDGASEIEILIPDAGSLVIGLGGETSGASPVDDTIYAGSQGLNLNAAEAGTGDLDVDVRPGTLSGLTAYGGDGNDSISTAGGHGTGPTGLQLVTLYGGTGDDILAAATGLSGVLTGGPGNDDLVGNGSLRGFGAITADYGGAPGPVTVTLGTLGSATDSGTCSGTCTGTDRLDNIFNVTGSAFADTLTGDSGANWITGDPLNALGGADTIAGLAGDDSLSGGGGNDTISGASGNDALYGDGGNDGLSGGNGNDALTGDSTVAAGNDQLAGDSGNDTLAPERGDDVVSGGDGSGDAVVFGSYAVSGVTADLTLLTPQDIGGGLGRKTFTGIEALTGTMFGDTLLGDDAANVLQGGTGAGSDTLEGRGGNDTLSFNLASSGGHADGGDGNDTITGSDGADTLLGGAGSDVINGRKGDDSLSGPADGVNDTLNCEDGNDTVTSFDLAFDAVSHCEILVGGVARPTQTTIAEPAPVAEPPAPAVVPPTATAAFGFPKLPTTKTGCLKGTSLSVTIRHIDGVTWERVAATAQAGSRRATRTVLNPPPANDTKVKVSLRGLQRGVFSLSLTATTSDGTTVQATRRSRTCAAPRKAAARKPVALRHTTKR